MGSWKFLHLATQDVGHQARCIGSRPWSVRRGTDRHVTTLQIPSVTIAGLGRRPRRSRSTPLAPEHPGSSERRAAWRASPVSRAAGHRPAVDQGRCNRPCLAGEAVVPPGVERPELHGLPQRPRRPPVDEAQAQAVFACDAARGRSRPLRCVPHRTQQYTCYGCHEHTPANMQAKHREEGVSESLDNCVRCHRSASGELAGTGQREGGKGRRERD